MSLVNKNRESIQVHRPPCAKTEIREGDAFRKHEAPSGRTWALLVWNWPEMETSKKVRRGRVQPVEGIHPVKNGISQENQGQSFR